MSLTVAPKPAMSQIMGVLDRLDDQATAAQVARLDLVNATQAFCQEQHLPYSRADIETAVQAELAPAAPQTASVLPTVVWGWARPSRAVNQQRPSVLERMMRWMGDRKGAVLRPMLPAIGIVALTMAIEQLSLPPIVHVTVASMGVFLGFFTWMFGDDVARHWVATRCEAREEAVVNDWDLRKWAGVAPCRRYVQACLASANPYLMEGDVTQLKKLAEAHVKAAAEQAKQDALQRFEAARAERTAHLHTLFND